MNNTGLSIYDADHDLMVDISPDQRSVASMTHQQVLLGAFMSAMALQKMVEERLYLALGCQSQEEYLTTMLPYSRRQAYRLLQIASKVGNVYKSLSGNGLNAPLLSESLGSAQIGTTEQSPAVPESEVSKMGLYSLLELTKIDDSDLKELVQSGKVEFQNGESLDWEELKNMTAREMHTQISKATGKYKAQVNAQRAEIAKLQEEAKLLKSEKEALHLQNAHAREIENKYGAVASRTQDKRNQLKLASDALFDFQELITRTGITDEDTLSLKKELILILENLDEAVLTIKEFYGNVILSME